MAEWDINRPLGQCAGTGKIIEPEEEYFAALVETDEGLERKDFCAEFWQQNQPGVYCFWKSKMPLPNQKKKMFIDDDMLMAFFERLAAETDPDKINFRFVLTLVLMRKRKLKYDNSRSEDGKEIWQLKIAGRGETVEVVNPHLTEEKIEELSSQIGEILQVELDE